MRLQASPTERGYNTDGTLEFDTKSGTWTHAIKVSDIPVATIGGANYWELFVDINDGNSTPLISLTDLEVYSHQQRHPDGLSRSARTPRRSTTSTATSRSTT